MRLIANFVLAACFFSGPYLTCFAQTSSGTLRYEYKERIDSATNVHPLGNDLFGDETNFENGDTYFRVTDVTVPSNVQIPVTVGRVMHVATSLSLNFPEVDIFGTRWAADIPYISGKYLAATGWVAPGSGRCSSGEFSLGVYAKIMMVVPAYNWFTGLDINIPGYGTERLLALLPDSARPSDGSVYVGTTKSNWKISCTSSIKNGSGEGFVVTLPDGAKYYFDWMAKAGTESMYFPWGYDGVDRMRMYATKAVDRFGGQVDYTYSASNPNQITRIKASDGPSIDLAYDSSSGKVATVSASGRIWTYTYSSSELQRVKLPDNSEWTYSSAFSPFGDTFVGCSFGVGTRTTDKNPDSGEYSSFTMKHPSGAIGVFDFRVLAFGYNRTPGKCISGTVYRPKAYLAYSLYRKSIAGPGMESIITDIKYYPSWSYVGECSGGCATSANTVVTENTGRISTYKFGNDYPTNAGWQLAKTVQDTNVSRSEIYEYLDSAEGQPFPDAIGVDKQQALNNPLFLKNRPLVRKIIKDEGREFVYKVDAYDQFARPTKVTKSSVSVP